MAGVTDRPFRFVRRQAAQLGADQRNGIRIHLTAALMRLQHVGSDSLNGVENLIGGSGNDSLQGDDQANALYGGLGSDTLQGMAGDDLLDGGSGSDVVTYAELDSTSFPSRLPTITGKGAPASCIRR